MRRLNATQFELLCAINSGVAVYWIEGETSFYFRADTMDQCSHSAKSLLEHGYVVKSHVDTYEHRLSPAPGTAHQIRITQRTPYKSQRVLDARIKMGFDQLPTPMRG